MIIRKIKKHLRIIKQCGIYTEVHTLFNHKVKKDYSDFELAKKREKYHMNLDISKYPSELSKWYKIQTGNILNLNSPKRFTEKIQWIKLYGMDDKQTLLSDKWCVREWIKEKIGQEYLFEAYGAWNSFDNIPFEKLPEIFMLKGNHGSHMNIKVEKKSADIDELRKLVTNWLSTNYAFSKGSFELQYLNIPRKVIAEKYMVDSNEEELKDYKFHCFNGIPRFCEVISERSKLETIDYFDMNWNHQDFIDEPLSSPIKNSKVPQKKPKCFDEMKKLSKILSKSFPYVRVDLYEIGEKVYFGEMTFTPAAGADVFTPSSADYMLGKMLKLPNVKKPIILDKSQEVSNGEVKK